MSIPDSAIRFTPFVGGTQYRCVNTAFQLHLRREHFLSRPAVSYMDILSMTVVR